jgi:hypothetical protein
MSELGWFKPITAGFEQACDDLSVLRFRKAAVSP